MNNPEQEDRKLARIISWITATIALLVAVSLPLGYFWLSWEAQKNEMAMEAKLHAAFVTQVIAGSPATWREEVGTLIEMELTHHTLPEVRSVADAQGRVLARSPGSLDAPVLDASAELFDANGNLAGHMQIARSLAPILRETLLVALLAATLGMAIFVTLRVLPLRALNRALGALHQEKQTLRENEERLRIVIDKAVDGIVTLDPHGVVESFNPAAERIFGYAAAEIVGANVSTLISPQSAGGEAQTAQILTVGQMEVSGKRRDGTAFPVELAIGEARHAGEKRYIAILRDITERKGAEEKLTYLANYDNLTGLPNRSLFRDRLSHAMAKADRSRRLIALMFLDLDRFKAINDTLGHEAGDRLLQHVAKLLQSTLRKCDTISRPGRDARDAFCATISRLGGDEFTLILEDIASADDAAVVAQKVLAAFAAHPLHAGTQEIYASTSIGIALYPADNIDIDGLIKQADSAMYRSKEAGRNAYRFFGDDLERGQPQLSRAG
jgi:diguanylate cyclase (GGDEF)-like protein/PAS domain S-box-containing protein